MEFSRARAVYARNVVPNTHASCWNQTSLLFMVCVREGGLDEHRIVYVSSEEKANLNPEWCVLKQDKRSRRFSDCCRGRKDLEEWIYLLALDAQGKWRILRPLKLSMEAFEHVGDLAILSKKSYEPNSVMLEFDDGIYLSRSRSLQLTTNNARASEDSLAVGKMLHLVFKNFEGSRCPEEERSDGEDKYRLDGRSSSYLLVTNKTPGVQDSDWEHWDDQKQIHVLSGMLEVVLRMRKLHWMKCLSGNLAKKLHDLLSDRKERQELLLATARSKQKITQFERSISHRKQRLDELTARMDEEMKCMERWYSMPVCRSLLENHVAELQRDKNALRKKGDVRRLATLQNRIGLYRGSLLKDLGTLFRIRSNVVHQCEEGLRVEAPASHEIRCSICGLDLEPVVWHYIFDMCLQWGGEGQERMERLASALGYAAIATKLVSRYLDVRLQFDLQPYGSHSFLLDWNPKEEQATLADIQTGAKPKSYPLFVDHAAKGAFTQAVYLFNRDLHQLLDVVGLGQCAQKQSFSNLHVLVSATQLPRASSADIAMDQ